MSMRSPPQTFAEAITPTHDQRILLYVMAGYIAGILILWNLPYVKVILYPFKLFTVALHEFCHAAVGCCTGAKIESITVNPDEGGLTKMLLYASRSLWDIVEDLVVRKVNSSDATRFAQMTGCPSQLCGLIWFLVSLAFLTAGVLGGLAVFKDEFDEEPLIPGSTIS
ncbi:hypothetical protein H4R34_000174 [Dimargaris verticillata]|uniref:Peptidase M50B-like-domain-containing protein n=1 Tax=Dimargaris verticillata TaxID=2761393 RepID=A0A9W8EG70_9FUNG|nr:hypothetical protein H4R34_000174 [Dimargaris verticillata]